MLVFILFLLLLASIFGVLAAVLKVALAIVLAVVLAVAVLVGGGYYYLRSRLRAWQREVERRRRHGEAHEIRYVPNEADGEPPGAPPALEGGG